MINVSDELKAAFLTGRQKYLTLTFSDESEIENEGIVVESMKIDQLLCSDNQLTFGLCNSSCFTVQIFNANVSHKDLWVYPEISVYDEENVEYTMALGVYKVVTDVVSDDRNTRTLTCYDSLYYVLNENYADWYTNLTLPMTLKQFRDSFFTEIGITQRTYTLPNDSMTIDKTIEATTLSGSSILKAILEPNAAFGFIDYEGKFKYVTWQEGIGLFPADDLYPSEDLYPVGMAAAKYGTTDESAPILGSLVYADYNVHEITGVKIQTSSSDEGVVVGSGNTYQILGNFLLYGKSTSDLQAIGRNFLNYADQLMYRPSKFKARCCPWIELGDFVQVKTKSISVMLPVLKRTITGITALYDEIQANGSETYMEQANNLTNMVENLQYRTLEIIQNVDEVSTTLTRQITDETTRATTQEQTILSQTSSAISAEVTRATTAEGTLSGRIDVNAGNIALKVSKGEVSSQISVESGGVSITGGRLTVESDNFKLYGNGNAEFSGDISASTIEGSTFKTTDNDSNPNKIVYIHDGKISIGTGNAAYINNFDNAVNGTMLIYAANDVDIDSDHRVSILARSGNISIQALNGNISLAADASHNVYVGDTRGMYIYCESEHTANVPLVFKFRDSVWNNDTLRCSYGTTMAGVQFMINTNSDERVKEDIKDIPDKFIEFYEALRPVSFKYVEGIPLKTYTGKDDFGFIAQDIIENLDNCGIENTNFVGTMDYSNAGFPEDTYKLEYNNFHALHTQYAHHLKDRIDELEAKNAELESRIARLEALIGENNE